MLSVTNSLIRNREAVLLFLLFLIVFVCFATFSGPFFNSLRTKKDVALSSELVKKRSPECPIPNWNTVQTDVVPHSAIGNAVQLEDGRILVRAKRLAPIAAFLFDTYILLMVNEKKNGVGRHVFCRYFDCLRREIPNQFESRIYPESVVYCPRRIGALFISVSGDVSDKPEYPIPIENRFTPSPTSTTVEVQIIDSNS